MTTSREKPPTDLELMQFFDGELEEPRKTAVAAFVGVDLGAKNKLAGLRVTSAFVQHQARSLPNLAAADDIADRVMAQIATQPQIAAQPQLVQAAAVKPAHGGVPVHSAQMPPRPAANDNSRWIFGLAGLAVAAAAALVVWGKQAPEPAAPTQSGPVAALSTPANPPSPLSAGPEAAGLEPQIDGAGNAPEAEPEHGVEVAAVNFGAHMGSIFYVPSGSVEANRTTTVVWLADDSGE